MVIPFILVACFAGVLGFMPLAVYLIWLSKVNRRGKPLVIAGTWDFVALFCGLGGLLLVGVFFWLSATQSSFLAWTRGSLEQVKASWMKERQVWVGSMAIYALVVGGGAVTTLVLRRKTLVVYGIDSTNIDHAIETALAKAGCNATRFGNRFSEGDAELVRYSPFRAMNAATVAIRTPNVALGEELERQLRPALEAAPAGKTAVGPWIGSAAYACSLITVCSFGLILLYIILTFRS